MLLLISFAKAMFFIILAIAFIIYALGISLVNYKLKEYERDRYN